MRDPIVSGLSSRVGSHRVEPLAVTQSGGVPGHGKKIRMGNEHFHLSSRVVAAKVGSLDVALLALESGYRVGPVGHREDSCGPVFDF